MVIVAELCKYTKNYRIACPKSHFDGMQIIAIKNKHTQA
jgi:hypothetical protein